MIKKLQRKFICIAMVSVILVLSGIIALINIVNYIQVGEDVDQVLEMLADNNGRFPKPDKMDQLKDLKKQNRSWFMTDGRMTMETPYETRFFSACINGDEIRWTNTGNVAAIDTGEAVEYVKEIAGSGKLNGYKDNYRFLVREISGGKLVVCVDCTRQLSTAASFLRGSILISLAGITAIFVLVLLLSGKAIRPIAESYEKQKKFITDSGHELKTPLAVIRANTEVIEMTAGESEWTQSIRNQVDRMTALTKELTSLARMDEDGFAFRKEEFCLSDTVAEISSEFRLMAGQKGIDYKEEIEKGIRYQGDSNAIAELVRILLDNACKYTEGEVCISLQRYKGKIKLDVYNTASEVRKGDNSQFFDRFYRADPSRSRAVEGFGIGLSIAESIVELHGGTIRAGSTDGRSLNITTLL